MSKIKIKCKDGFDIDKGDYIFFDHSRDYRIKVPNYQPTHGNKISLSNQFQLLAVAQKDGILFIETSKIHNSFGSGVKMVSLLAKNENLYYFIPLKNPTYITFFRQGEMIFISNNEILMIFQVERLEKPIFTYKIPCEVILFDHQPTRFIVQISSTFCYVFNSNTFDVIHQFDSGTYEYVSMCPANFRVALVKGGNIITTGNDPKDLRMEGVIEIENCVKIENLKWITENLMIMDCTLKSNPDGGIDQEENGEIINDQGATSMFCVLNIKKKEIIKFYDALYQDGLKDQTKRKRKFFSFYLNNWGIVYLASSNTSDEFGKILDETTDSIISQLDYQIEIPCSDEADDGDGGGEFDDGIYCDGLVCDFGYKKGIKNIFKEPDPHKASPLFYCLLTDHTIMCFSMINKFSKEEYPSNYRVKKLRKMDMFQDEVEIKEVKKEVKKEEVIIKEVKKEDIEKEIEKKMKESKVEEKGSSKKEILLKKMEKDKKEKVEKESVKNDNKPILNEKKDQKSSESVKKEDKKEDGFKFDGKFKVPENIDFSQQPVGEKFNQFVTPKKESSIQRTNLKSEPFNLSEFGNNLPDVTSFNSPQDPIDENTIRLDNLMKDVNSKFGAQKGVLFGEKDGNLIKTKFGPKLTELKPEPKEENAFDLIKGSFIEKSIGIYKGYISIRRKKIKEKIKEIESGIEKFKGFRNIRDKLYLYQKSSFFETQHTFYAQFVKFFQNLSIRVKNLKKFEKKTELNLKDKKNCFFDLLNPLEVSQKNLFDRIRLTRYAIQKKIQDLYELNKNISKGDQKKWSENDYLNNIDKYNNLERKLESYKMKFSSMKLELDIIQKEYVEKILAQPVLEQFLKEKKKQRKNNGKKMLGKKKNQKRNVIMKKYKGILRDQKKVKKVEKPKEKVLGGELNEEAKCYYQLMLNNLDISRFKDLDQKQIGDIMVQYKSYLDRSSKSFFECILNRSKENVEKKPEVKKEEETVLFKNQLEKKNEEKVVTENVNENNVKREREEVIVIDVPSNEQKIDLFKMGDSSGGGFNFSFPETVKKENEKIDSTIKKEKTAADMVNVLDAEPSVFNNNGNKEKKNQFFDEIPVQSTTSTAELAEKAVRLEKITQSLNENNEVMDLNQTGKKQEPPINLNENSYNSSDQIILTKSTEKKDPIQTIPTKDPIQTIPIKKRAKPRTGRKTDKAKESILLRKTTKSPQTSEIKEKPKEIPIPKKEKKKEDNINQIDPPKVVEEKKSSDKVIESKKETKETKETVIEIPEKKNENVVGVNIEKKTTSDPVITKDEKKVKKEEKKVKKEDADNWVTANCETPPWEDTKKDTINYDNIKMKKNKTNPWDDLNSYANINFKVDEVQSKDEPNKKDEKDEKDEKKGEKKEKIKHKLLDSNGKPYNIENSMKKFAMGEDLFKKETTSVLFDMQNSKDISSNTWEDFSMDKKKSEKFFFKDENVAPPKVENKSESEQVKVTEKDKIYDHFFSTTKKKTSDQITINIQKPQGNNPNITENKVSKGEMKSFLKKFVYDEKNSSQLSSGTYGSQNFDNSNGYKSPRQFVDQLNQKINNNNDNEHIKWVPNANDPMQDDSDNPFFNNTNQPNQSWSGDNYGSNQNDAMVDEEGSFGDTAKVRSVWDESLRNFNNNQNFNTNQNDGFGKLSKLGDTNFGFDNVNQNNNNNNNMSNVQMFNNYQNIIPNNNNTGFSQNQMNNFQSHNDFTRTRK